MKSTFESRKGFPPDSGHSSLADDRYEVYAHWETDNRNPTNAPYAAYHEGSSTTVAVSQEGSDNVWVLLGTSEPSGGTDRRGQRAGGAGCRAARAGDGRDVPYVT